MITIPPRTTKIIRQLNRGKTFGELWASFGIDLQSDPGIIKISPRLRINTSGVSNQGLSIAFKTFDQKVFTIAGSRVFKSASYDLISAFTEDASAGALTTYSTDFSDMETFNSTLCTATTGKLLSKAVDGSGTGAWTERASFASTSSLHKLCYFTRHERLYFIDNFNTIKSIDTSWSVATSGDYFINIDFKHGAIYTMDADSTDIWIGTLKPTPSGITDSMSGASILRWDGISSQITAEYPVKASGVLALCKDDAGVMHAIDSNGALLAFTSSGFQEIGRLPLNKKLLVNAQSASVKYNSFVHPNGLRFTRNGTFIVAVNNLVGDSGSTINENLPSGIWEFTRENGFVHRQSFSLSTLASASITDHGQNRVSQVGALYEPNIYSTSASGKPTLICGATYYSDASNTSNGIFVDDPLDSIQKYGYFVTQWISSQELKDVWQKVGVKYRKFLDSADKIWVKYRLTDSDATDMSITWVNTTSFTTTTNVLGKEGYEVEITQGTGSGKCAHITRIDVTAGTYTVTLDETFSGVTTGTAKARSQAWIKTLVTDNLSTESVLKTITNAISERIQVKCCMQFTGADEFHELILISAPHIRLI